MRIVLVSIIVSILVSAPLAQAQTHPLQESRLQPAPVQKSKAGIDRHLELKAGEKDYLLEGEGFVTGPPVTVKASISKYTAANAGPVESVVQYKSFTFGTTVSLNAFSGKYVSYLIPQNLIGAAGLSREEIRELVDLTDVLYAHMIEVVGAEPAGDGLLTIALLNPGYDFGGRGWVGKKGVEMYEGYALDYKKDFLAGCVPIPVIHELSHNFDIYNAYISHDGNNYHAWTAFLIPYMQYYTQTGASRQGRVVAPAILLDQTITNYMSTWDAAGATASWQDCVKTGGDCDSQEIYSNEIWGGVVLRLARLHGPSAVRRAFRFLAEYKNSHPTPPLNAEGKNDVLISAFADGARNNIQCELDVWRWPVSLETTNQMKLDFPGQNSSCNDADNDGHTPTKGDRDDFSTGIHPGAADTLNGIDDDCNSIIDDTLLQETDDFPSDANSAPSVSIPGHVIGRTATTEDSDSYRIEMSTARSLNIWAKGIAGNFNGWFELRYASDPISTAPIYANVSNASGTIIPFSRAGTWVLTVKPWSGGGQGYELFFNEIQSEQLPQLRIVSSKADLIFANVSTEQRLGEAAPTHARLWAEGMGFIAQQNFQPVTIFKWSTRNLSASGANIRLRAQFLAGDSPASGTTKSVGIGPIRTNVVATTVSRITPTVAGPTLVVGSVWNSREQTKSKPVLIQHGAAKSRHRRKVLRKMLRIEGV